MNHEILKQFSTIESSEHLFLSFEGIEGSGKSTQIKNLTQHLNDQGYDTLTLREPGGTIFGENLRAAILNSTEPLAPIAEAYLFASARAQLLTEKILPHLKRPKSAVLLDRYIDSSLAYQGVARGLGIETILNIHLQNPLNILPQKTFYLEIPLEVSLERQDKRGNVKDYFESEKSQFTQKLIDGFKTCTEYFPERIAIINGQDSAEKVFENILKELAI